MDATCVDFQISFLGYAQTDRRTDRYLNRQASTVYFFQPKWSVLVSTYLVLTVRAN